MFFILLSLQCVFGTTLFDLDESSVVLLPVGGTVQLQKKAEIHKAITWVVEDPKIFRLKIKSLKPKKEIDTPFSLPKYSVFEASCTRDCKIGEEFKVKLNYKKLLKEEIHDTTEITIRVVEPNLDL